MGIEGGSYSHAENGDVLEDVNPARNIYTDIDLNP